MRNDRLIAAGAVAAGLFVAGIRADGGDMSVLFVGNRDERVEEFEALLEQHFEIVEVVRRDDFTPALAEPYDVVLLDWSQREIDRDSGGMAALASPLGPREHWRKPTVLLGSAGLLLAAPWQTNGSYG